MSDNLCRIEKFNTVAGFPRKKRDLTDEAVVSAASFVTEEYDEFIDEFRKGELLKTLDGLGDTVVTAIGVIHRLGFDSNEIMDIINGSNESKFCYNIRDADMSVEKYRNDSRYTGVYYKLVDGVYVIMGKVVKTGKEKILKGINFKEPDEALKEVIDRVYK